MDQAAKGPLPDHRLLHRHGRAVDCHEIEIEGRLAIAPRQALEQFGRGGDVAAHMRMRKRIGRIVEPQPGDPRNRARRSEREIGHLMPLIRIWSHRPALPPPNSRSADCPDGSADWVMLPTWA